MSENLLPPPTAALPAPTQPPSYPTAASGFDTVVAPSHTSPLERPLAAIRRYKWLILGVVVAAVVGGAVATRFVKPEYLVQATIWLNSETPMAEKNGPIRSNELLNAQAWVELLRSYRIADNVVRKLSLFVQPAKDADSTLFSSFAVADRFIPGDYEFKIDRDRKRWRLAIQNTTLADSGAATDSVGRTLGLRWLPPISAFKGTGERKVAFTVRTPRETSIELMQRLSARLPERSNFLWVTLQDPNAQLAARTLNMWVNEYVSAAAELKKKNMVEFAKILGEQLRFAETSLHDAETSLENFRIHTITLPTEGGPVAAGVQETQDPVMKSFFERKIEYDNLRHDRESLEQVIAAARSGKGQYEAALLIPWVSQSPGGTSLRSTFDQLYKLQAQLTSMRQVYTDKYPDVQRLSGLIETLQKQTIPQQANELLAQLKDREGQFDDRIKSASQDLQAIPARTIEEMRLRRAVTVAEGLYGSLKSRYAEAELATASATPDVNILDSAVAPLKPTKNTTPRIMLMAIFGGLGAAIGLALLLDTMDRRLWYSSQASNELGLRIAGVVPRIPKGGIDANSPDQVSQLVESFRSLRMNVMLSSQPMALTITSPSPGDGKSLVSANLAMSFSDAGYRTLLVDGDTRRGTLHQMFGIPQVPGLTEYLSGEVERSATLHPTAHERLTLVPCGKRRPHSPELLTSPALRRFVEEMRAQYEVVIIDTPPLAAGIDSYAIGATTGNMLVVLRVGQTERRMAAAKLQLVDQLPIDVIGAVLNCAEMKGEYQYYGYAHGYGLVETAQAEQIAQISQQGMIGESEEPAPEESAEV